MPTMKIPTLAVIVLLAGLNALASSQGPETIASAGGGIAVHPINHATFVMEHDGTTIYVDPVGGGLSVRHVRNGRIDLPGGDGRNEQR